MRTAVKIGGFAVGLVAIFGAAAGVGAAVSPDQVTPVSAAEPANGGMAGHEVEKRVRSETVYEVRVRMDNGTTRTITQHSAPAQGSRVTVDNNGVHAM